MTFDNVHRILRWFVNEKFLRPPRLPGNHDLVSMGSRKAEPCFMDVWITFFRIAHVLSELSDNELHVIIKAYSEEPTIRINRSRYTIWRIKRRVMSRLEQRFEEVGLISHRYEPPMYVTELGK